MSIETWTQLAAVIAAVGASIVALGISAADRRNARLIADADRVAALKHSNLLFEQAQLLRLLENARRGGSTDPLERARLGGEAAGIIGLIGPERLPRNWANRITSAEDPSLDEHLDDATAPEWQKNAIEVQRALDEVTAEIRREIAKAKHSER